MSLFDRLRRLYRKDKFQMEDFLTEIVAQVLDDSPELTLEWLHQLGATHLQNPVSIKVVTQEEYSMLEGHHTDSRPDIAIRLTKDGLTELIFVESKVGALEGPDQLKRYAEHLIDKIAKGIDRAALIFITRDFEPERVFPNSGTQFVFRQRRWFEFFQLLKAHAANSDGLAKQLMLFMEQNRMSLRNQFTAIDSLALSNFVAARKLMDETLWGKVSQAFEATLGKISSEKKTMFQLRDHNRYVMFVSLGKTWDLFCFLGYFLPSEQPADQTKVGIVLHTNPKSPRRKEMVQAFKAFSEAQGQSWQQGDLDDEKAWSGISKQKELREFMAQDDHVKAIQDYFLSLLAEVKQFRNQNPDLPWAVSAANDGADDLTGPLENP